MKVEELTGSQLFTAGIIITKIAEEIQKIEKNEETKEAMEYILKKIDDINKEIAGTILIKIKEGMDTIYGDSQI